MRLITRKELKEKIDKKEKFKLVFVLGEWHFRAKHIPGSIHIDSPENTKKFLKKNDDIVVYCAGVSCTASIYAYSELEKQGYKNVRRYAGGIADWEDAGFTLEGELVEKVEPKECTHLDQIRKVRPSAKGCVECLKMEDEWVHLRMCLICGHVGCCNQSKNKHATKHFMKTGHPIVKSHEPGEEWKWCYVDEIFIEE